MNKFLILIFGILFSMTAMAVPVNVNSASAEEIAMALKGVGPSKAQAIVEFCKQNDCNKPEDLLKVKGIGQKTLDKIKDDLRF